MSNRIFTPADTNAIAATATSQSRAFAAGGDNAYFYNVGTAIAFVVTGDENVVATLPAVSTNAGAAGNGTPIPVGGRVNIDRKASHTHWAVICPAAGTATVYCTPGVGE